MMKRIVTIAAWFVVLAITAKLGSSAIAAPNASPWGADYFPNVPLVTQDGKTVRFYEDLLKDKKVLVNFVFALCDQSCPLDTANMARIQKLLGERVGRDIFMYSITLDPEHDTPQTLQTYARQFGAGPGWTFLTGKREDIDAIRYKLGQRSAKEEHANTVQIGDVAKGQWMRVPLTADPNSVLVEINSTFFPNWSAGKPLKSIADAPRPEIFGPGQLIFQSRCAACHSFGKGAQIGPDLQGVAARRNRDWLFDYLAAPDRMRTAKDPVAIELARNYTVLMPNLGLTNKELGEVVAYLEAKSVPAGHEHHHHHDGGEH